MAKLLILKGADVHSNNRIRRTPLHWASLEGYEVVVGLLIENGADIYISDKNSRIPLH